MSDKMKTSGIDLRSAYQREWRKKNKEKVKAYQERYWERKAIREELQRKEMQKHDRSGDDL